ncbi:MAG: hypothetical protein IPM79_24855, partial [Polyangiaceae bacterium]|nr:hypothetical protein [Polyangiaceae bacterium]
AAARRGIAEAVNSINGTAFLRRVGAVGNDPVFLSLAIGDLTWELRIPVSDRGVDLRWGEAIKLGGQVLGRRATFSDQMFFGATERAADERTVLKALWDFDRDERLRPLVDWTNSTRVYSDFWFNKVVRPQPANSDSFPNAHGTNVWSVLRSWKAARESTEISFVGLRRRSARPSPT